MKLFLAVIAVCAAISARAQYVPATPTEDAMETHILQQASPSRQQLLTLQPLKPNEIRSGRVTYSGSMVELYKTRQPLQLVNPAAPAEYGLPEDNTAIDPAGRGTGLKLFSVQF